RDWSSDVCSSDLIVGTLHGGTRRQLDIGKDNPTVFLRNKSCRHCGIGPPECQGTGGKYKQGNPLMAQQVYEGPAILICHRAETNIEFSEELLPEIHVRVSFMMMCRRLKEKGT